ncbi:MAG: hypothetical protein KC800_02995 [Candidatus Eremiobacteraeota bacterium]|nr:hypothetical protein [Candidatus Eremiobacteraeota bacterium]
MRGHFCGTVGGRVVDPKNFILFDQILGEERLQARFCPGQGVSRRDYDGEEHDKEVDSAALGGGLL